MGISERIKLLRKEEGLNQLNFGKRIGITESAICNFENGRRNPSEQTIKSICREFHVNYDWLKNGIEPKNIDSDKEMNPLLQTLKTEYNLDDLDVKIMQIYITLSSNEREAFKSFIKKMRDAD